METLVNKKIQLGLDANVKDKNFSCIYLIISPTLDHYPFFRYYVGRTRNFKNRVAAYNNVKEITQRKLRLSFKKYGREKHIIEVLYKCREEELNFFEPFFIKLLNTFDTEHGMNLMVGGDVKEVSQETRQKMSDFRKGKKHSEEHVRKVAESRKNGDGYSEQALKNIREEHVRKGLEQRYPKKQRKSCLSR